MRNKVEIRAFAVEQVVKMRCMSDCTIEDVVEQSKLIEGYIVGDARIPEFADEVSDMMDMMKGLRDKLVDELENKHREYPIIGCGLKPNEA